ncbi:DUF2249 domain-containing protein [Paenibacillus ginsengihumi]|uniref:DUF2249 domain-containing protein n=1 Tax=Paenibacillus ginsengihumi TaxID=431596 RepID=UPI000476A946|nr:DUF2249 domain-containing protein [Paenibacillus ginsengihumi]
MNRKEAKVVELDVRPQLRNKLEPFQLIMETVKSLGKDDIFVLHATIKPTPLFGVLKLKGFAGKAEQVGEEHWVSTFVSKKNKHWLDETASGEQPAAAAADAAEAVPPTDGTDDAGEGAGAAQRDPVTISLDNRGLEPPQPMIRTLAALERCRPGDAVTIHNDRVPMFLIEELHSLGYPYEVEEQPDGSAKVTIRKV